MREMMPEYEIEIKSFCDNVEFVRDKLADIGAEYIRTDFESDIYFNHPERDFGKTDEALRIRTVNDQSILTFKGPKISSRSKARIEEETGIENGDSLVTILGLLGFKESGNVNKKREYYLLDTLTITIDSVEYLGTFVEIEKKGSDLEMIEQELYEVAECLKINTFERRSYLELVLEKTNSVL